MSLKSTVPIIGLGLAFFLRSEKEQESENSHNQETSRIEEPVAVRSKKMFLSLHSFGEV